MYVRSPSFTHPKLQLTKRGLLISLRASGGKPQMPKVQRRIAGIKWVSKGELKKVLDAKVRRVLGYSGETFQRRYSAGTLGPQSLDGKAGTVELATLCFFTGEKKSAKSKRKR